MHQFVGTQHSVYLNKKKTAQNFTNIIDGFKIYTSKACTTD